MSRNSLSVAPSFFLDFISCTLDNPRPDNECFVNTIPLGCIEDMDLYSWLIYPGSPQTYDHLISGSLVAGITAMKHMSDPFCLFLMTNENIFAEVEFTSLA